MYFAEEKLTGDIAIDSFMGSTIVGFAEWERIQIQRRTHSGKIQHARENKWGFSYVPYGYIKNPTTKYLEIYEDEARIVKLIYRLYLEEGYTLDGLARYLTNEKIPPPSLSSKGTNNQKSIASSRKNSSGQWIASTIYRILER
jgi:site-specific DNA recombinase